jgi:hypothetical protein
MARVFRPKRSAGKLKLPLFVLAVLAIILGIWWVAGTMENRNNEQQLIIAQEAISRATIQCYSLEGRYPPNLQYLVDNYGITLNEDRFVYYYQSIGTNLMPDIRVFALEGELRG